jgi:cytochrome b
MTTHKEVKVWDIFVRVFHWTLVISFVIAYFTGDEDNLWHIYLGYYIGFLIIFRLIWGFVGTQHAHFADFVTSPGNVIAYIKSMIAGNPKHYLGHNPAGGYMVLALLFMLTVTTISGLKVYGIEGHGPLADTTHISLISVALADDDEDDEKHERGEHEEDKEGEEFWEEIHEVSANLTVLLILLHILGVIMSSKIHGENLVRSMITGKKEEKS